MVVIKAYHFVQTLFLKCLLIEFLKENSLWQIWQKKDFFFVCFSMWVFRWSFLLKDILQVFFGHGYDFSLVWILMWRFRFLYVEKVFLQDWHMFSFEDGTSISFFWFSLCSNLTHIKDYHSIKAYTANCIGRL